MRPDTVMLFAAGFGTRMHPLTQSRPKPMISVAGQPLIDHALEQVRCYGARRVVCNLHYLPDTIKAHLADSDVFFSHETQEILDTGGGLKAALPLLDCDTVFTMNTDAVWRGPNALDHLAQAWDPTSMDALLLCVPKKKAIGHAGEGDFVIELGGRAIRGPGTVFTGLQIVKTSLVRDISDKVFSMNVVWDKILAKSRLFATVYTGAWCDVGSPKGIALAEALLEQGDV